VTQKPILKLGNFVYKCSFINQVLYTIRNNSERISYNIDSCLHNNATSAQRINVSVPDTLFKENINSVKSTFKAILKESFKAIPKKSFKGDFKTIYEFLTTAHRREPQKSIYKRFAKDLYTHSDYYKV
jgi:hypothetical protein